MNQDHQMVTRPGDLERLCGELRAAGAFALDLEFASERSYTPRLQLIQVSLPERPAIIDPLALDDLTPLFDLVRDPAILKITHAGKQDAEILNQRAGGPPTAIFDTQIAAALLGMGDQIGYGNLVQKLLDIKLKKTEQVTDWSVRPLSESQVRYAIADVLHLPRIHQILSDRLEETGRTAWLEEELAFYADPATYERDVETLFLKVSGNRSLDRRGLAILRELSKWREAEAARRDDPRGRVVADEVLVEIAHRRPRSPEDLRPMRRLHPRERERSGARIVEAVARGLAVPDHELPTRPRGLTEDPELALAVNLLDVMVRVKARENSIAPSYLGNHRSVRILVDFLTGRAGGEGTPRLLEGWRKQLVGNDLVALFEGRQGLRIDPETRQPAGLTFSEVR